MFYVQIDVTIDFTQIFREEQNKKQKQKKMSSADSIIGAISLW